MADDAHLLTRLRATGELRAHPGLMGRHHDSGVEEERATRGRDARWYSSGFGEAMLRRQGWEEGRALGRTGTRQSALTVPLAPRAPANPRAGLGLGRKRARR